MEHIPDSKQYLLKDETRAFAFLATLMPDGSPQVTPLWFNTDGEHILINSAKGRVKDLNMRARPQVALTIMALDKPYDYLQIRGEVVEITEEGGFDHINELARKYGRYPFGGPRSDVRVTYKILPTR